MVSRGQWCGARLSFRDIGPRWGGNVPASGVRTGYTLLGDREMTLANSFLEFEEKSIK